MYIYKWHHEICRHQVSIVGYSACRNKITFTNFKPYVIHNGEKLIFNSILEYKSFIQKSKSDMSNLVNLFLKQYQMTYFGHYVNFTPNMNMDCSLITKEFIQTIDVPIPELFIGSFDLECTRYARDGKFPDYSNPRDEIKQIGITISSTTSHNIISKRIFIKDTYPDTCPDSDTFSLEKDLLLAFAKYISTAPIHILTGYNICGFDFNYIFQRCNIHCCEKQFLEILNASFKQFTISRTAGIYNSFIDIPNLVIVDIYEYVIAMKIKSKNKKLNTIAQQFINKSKIDIDILDTFRIYEEGTLEEKAKIAEYCLTDCSLCNELFNALGILNNITIVSNRALLSPTLCFLRNKDCTNLKNKLLIC